MWNMDILGVAAWAVAVFFILSIAVLTVLWIALPFSIFGIKDLLRELIEEQRKTNALIRDFKKEKSGGVKDVSPGESKDLEF
jgi:hypothetical protein